MRQKNLLMTLRTAASVSCQQWRKAVWTIKRKKMKIRKTKKRYKLKYRVWFHKTIKVKFKKVSTSIETEPRQYPKMCGVFITYEVLRWYRTRELITRYVRIRIGAVKSKTSRKIK